MKSDVSLYEIVGVSEKATPDEIKKAYRRLALHLHPDKNTAPDAQEKFQQLQRVYSILSDPDKRKVYDQTGSIGDAEELDSSDFKSLYEFFKSQLEEITEDKLVEYHNKYRGSQAEECELHELYQRFNGNMVTVMAYLPCCDEAIDSHRFMDMVDKAIQSGDLTASQSYKKWKAKISKKSRPKDPLKPKEASAPHNDLVMAIQKRNANAMDAMADALAAKYGAKPKKKAKKGASK